MFHTNPEFNFPLFTLFKISWPGEEGNEVAAGAVYYVQVSIAGAV